MKNNVLLDINYTSSQKFFDENSFQFWKEEEAPIIVAVGIRSPENIGGLIRLSSALSCRALLLANNETEHNVAKVRRTATTGFRQNHWRYVPINGWKSLIPDNYQIVALETSKDAVPIFSLHLPSKIALVVGDERYGVDVENLKLCQQQVFIPLSGPVKSLNVVQATSMAMYAVLQNHWVQRL
jgi:tRNA G18 (ribose-2'-O)-methylase SpoU